jgi:hypothetical protein
MRLQTVTVQQNPEFTPSPVTGAAEPSWRADVTTKLDSLQKDVAGIKGELEDDRKQASGPRRAWIWATLVLVVAALLVLGGVLRGLVVSTEAGAAGRLEAQAASLSNQLERAVHSEAARCQGAAGSAATLRCEINAANISPNTYETLINDELRSRQDLGSADVLELEGPTVLTFGSALAGAALGWMLTQWLGSRRFWRSLRRARDQRALPADAGQTRSSREAS